MKHLAVTSNLLLLLVSLAAAQNGGNAAEVQNLQVVRNGDRLQVEVTLTNAVSPSVITATAPDRLVLELPNTGSDAKQRRFAVDRNGVKAVRFGLNQANPPLTHVVVDLESARAYELSMQGNKVILTILPDVNFAHSNHRDGAAPAAASSSLAARLHKPAETVPTMAGAAASAPVTAPVALAPLTLPNTQTPAATANNTGAGASSHPSAAHPNFGSLQQGTVFPSMGTPGAGSVPGVRETATTSQLNATAASAPASNGVPSVAVVGALNQAGTKKATVPGESAAGTTVSTTAIAGQAAKPAPTATAAVQAAVTTSSQPTGTFPAVKAPASVSANDTAIAAKALTISATTQAKPTVVTSTNQLAGSVPAITITAPANSATSSKPIAAVATPASQAPAVPTPTTPERKAAVVTSANQPAGSVPAVTITAAANPATSSKPLTAVATQASQPAAAPTATAVQKSSATVAAATTSAATTNSGSAPMQATAANPFPVAPVGASTSNSGGAAVQATASNPFPGTPANASVTKSTPTLQATAANPFPAGVPTENSAKTTVQATAANPFPGGAPAIAETTTNQATAANPIPAGTASLVEVTPEGPAGDEPAVTAAVIASAEVQPEMSGSGEAMIPALATRQPNSDIRMSYKVKYVTEGAAYLDGGRAAGLTEGLKLEIYDDNPALAHPGMSAHGEKAIAELEVISVAETSAVSEIHQPKRDVKAGDLAYLTSEDTETMVAQRSLSATRKYPTVISFTAGDPLDEDARAMVPHEPLPEINRARGRIGFDYSGVMSHGAVSSISSSMGMTVRTDFTRIGGTYWNMSGYWRGRMTRQSAGPQTLQDLLNRTYHLGLTYDNPNSPWVAGVGRLYLPWATSLDTIDGGYFGRRITKGTILGVFAGSTPDPTSFSYNPDRRLGGAFVNFEGGSFEGFRYTSTSGMGISTLKWKIDRPFVFFENGIYYKRIFSIYDSLQADSPAGNPAVAAPGPGISRSFLTFRVQPVSRLEFDVNHTYFRDVPTFDPTLIGTGLLDKYLFQGFSAGPRIEVFKEVWVYSTIGRSSRSGDTTASLNQLYGINFGHLPWTRIRADVHYSKFSSAFGAGKYSALSISRSFHDSFRWELLTGYQTFNSALATGSSSHFATANIEAPVGRHYFFQGGFTWNRGGTQNYDQVLFSFGYRFDSRNNRK